MNKITRNDYGKLSRHVCVVLVTLQLLFLAGAEATDIYALFNYHEKSEVYLVFSTKSPAYTFGKLFLAHPVKAFHMDKLNHFRLAFFDQTGDFKTMPRRLHRQVYDGLPVLADRGVGGYAQHQDQRDRVVPDQSGRPVFRSRGAPFSPGPGFMVPSQIAWQNLVPGEVEVVPQMNWYEIPNASWYQTWFASGAGDGLSYMIFYDRWEEQTFTVRESLWSGFPVFRSDEKTIGEFANSRLLRAKVDGIMEIPASASGLVSEMNHSTRVVVLQYDSASSVGVKTAIYSWSGEEPGALYADNQRLDFNLVMESKHKQARFPAMPDENRLLVMGTDILHGWLELQGLRRESSECTFSGLVPFRENTHALFVYSAPDNSLYRFLIDEKSVGPTEKPQITNLAFVPCAMTIDLEGNLILGGFSVWPLSISDDENLLMSVEAIELAPEKPDFKGVKGTMLLAQQHYFNVYRANPETVDPVWLGRLNVGRHLYQCSFVLAGKPENFTNDVRELIRLARQNGNSLTAPKRLSEQEQPGQFVLPHQVYMAISR